MARELTEIEEAWLEALGPYLEMKACALGLCPKADAVEATAKTHPEKEVRDKALQTLEALRYEAQAKWVAAVRRVEHLHIAAAVRNQ